MPQSCCLDCCFLFHEGWCCHAIVLVKLHDSFSLFHKLFWITLYTAFDQMTCEVCTCFMGEVLYSWVLSLPLMPLYYGSLIKARWNQNPLVMLDGHNNNNSPKAEQYKLYCTVNLSMNRTWLKCLLCHVILSWLQKWELKGKYVLSTTTKLKCTVNI